MNNYIYTLSWRGLKVFDIEDPYISLVAEIDTLWSIGLDHCFSIKDGYIYLSKVHGMAILDLTDIHDITQVAFIDTMYYLIPHGELAFTTIGLKFRVLNLNDPVMPTCIGEVELPLYTHIIGMSDNLVFASNIEEGMKGDMYILDVSEPENPFIAGKYVSYNDYWAFYCTAEVAGDYAYFRGFSGIEIVNLENPENPRLVGVYSDVITTEFGYMDGLEVVDGLIYVANVRSLDVLDPSAALSLPSHSCSPLSCYILSAFPNPFNSSTTLSFTLPHEESISLKVYDLSGREIAKLHSGLTLPGVHRAVWDASDISTGVYIARLQSAEQTSNRNITLIK